MRVIKPSLNGEIALVFTDVGKSYFSRELLTSQKCLGTIQEHKIPSKISEFTVFVWIFRVNTA